MNRDTLRLQKNMKPIDGRDLTLADLLDAIRRLKLSALAAIIGVLASSFAAFAAYIHHQYQPRLEAFEEKERRRAEFNDRFTIRFADRDVLVKLVRSIRSEAPDGIDTDDEAIASLLWQAKSQSGFAEFLSGNTSQTIKVVFEEGSTRFEWDNRPNLLAQIMKDEKQVASPGRLRQLNAEMNLLGLAWLSDDTHVVRGVDGGLKVVRTSR